VQCCWSGDACGPILLQAVLVCAHVMQGVVLYPACRQSGVELVVWTVGAQVLPFAPGQSAHCCPLCSAVGSSADFRRACLQVEALQRPAWCVLLEHLRPYLPEHLPGQSLGRHERLCGPSWALHQVASCRIGRRLAFQVVVNCLPGPRIAAMVLFRSVKVSASAAEVLLR